MTIRDLWEEGYIPAALGVLIVLAFVALYLLFRIKHWNLLWYWVTIAGLVVGTVLGYLRSRMA